MSDPPADLADLHRRLLRTIAMDLIEQEVYRRGRIVCVATRCRFGDRLPPGYPPLGDLDEGALPFEEDGRE
jgi:hypothetical protein